MKIALRAAAIVLLASFLGFLLLVMFGIAGYGDAKFDDVSARKPYSQTLGMIVVSKKELMLHGWTESDHTVDTPVFYAFSLPPGANNRFVKSRTRLQAGVELKVVAVEVCNNCWFGLERRVQFRVSPLNIEVDHDRPIYLSAPLLIQDWGKDDGPVVFDDSVFVPRS